MTKRENILARPLEEQRLAPVDCLRSPHEKLSGDPAARRRAIDLLALERSQWEQYQCWYRGSAEDQLKVLFAEVGRTESQHALALASLLDPSLPALERALTFEQAALDTYGLLAQEEPDPYVRQGFEYVLLEVLEHAYHVAEALRASGRDPEAVTLGALPLRRGRPLDEQHLAAFDAVKRPCEKRAVDPLTRARLQLAGALARALHDDYRQLITLTPDDAARRLFARVRAVKEAHASFFESFLDPTETPFEQAVSAEFGEAAFYRRYLDEEEDPILVALYRRHLADETAHLTLWEAELRRREGQDPWPLTHSRQQPAPAPAPLAGLVETLLKTQLKRRSKGKSYVDIGKTVEAFS